MGVDPTFYRMIGELTGEVRGLKESLDFRTRHTETQVGEIRAELRHAKHETNNARMKMTALERMLGHDLGEMKERVGDVDRRIDTLDAKVTKSERPIEELMTLRVRALAWLGGASASGAVLWLFIGHRIVAIVQWVFEFVPEDFR